MNSTGRSSAQSGSLAYNDEIVEQPATPVSYALYTLPPKTVLRKKGYSTEELYVDGRQNHPLATWKSYGLKKGVSLREAINIVEEANHKTFGVLKARIIFSDGSQQLFARSDANNASSFRSTEDYNPNGVFKNVTSLAASQSRAIQLPKLAALSDSNGHPTVRANKSGKPIKSFAPEKLFQDCPPPVTSQAGFDFTPVSSNGFLLRPADPKVGTRDVQSNFTHKANDFRPRSYLRDETNGGVHSRHCHCAEVYQVGDYTMDLSKSSKTIDNRNRRTVHNYTQTGALKPNSTIVGKRNVAQRTIPCEHQPGDESMKSAGTMAAEEAAAEQAHLGYEGEEEHAAQE